MRLTSGDPSHRAHTPTEGEDERSHNSTPTAQSCQESTDKQAAAETSKPVTIKGIILVSEAFTEINAGLVIVLASRHRSPIPESDLVDPDRDPDELATIASTTVTMLTATYRPPNRPVILKQLSLVDC